MDWWSFSATWDEAQARWSAGWRSAFQDAQRWWSGEVDLDLLESWFDLMDTTDQDIQALQVAAAALPPSQAQVYQGRASGYRQVWNDIGAGVYPYVTQSGIGAAPFVIVGGLAVAGAGVAWAMYSYDKLKLLAQQAATDRVRAETERAEFEARRALAAEGKQLQPSTLPQQQQQAGDTKPPDTGTNLIGVAVGLGALGLVITAVLRAVGGGR